MEKSIPETTQHVRVQPDHAGERLDRFVAQAVADISRSYVHKLIAEGHIRINNRHSKPAQPVKAGDVITISYPERQSIAIVPEHISLTVVYEDNDIAVIDKPAGMVVHPSPGHFSGTLVHALLARYPDMRIHDDMRPGIVHRLDMDTSGLIVVARNDHAMHVLTTQQKARQMHKTYLTVVEGRFKEPTGLIDAPIGRHPNDRKRQAIMIKPSCGREARTRYTVLEELGTYTLLEVTLETGRTHQIRVHLSHIQRPVLADPLYGPRKPRATFGLQRQFLHAHTLGLSLPSDNTWHTFTSPLPDDLAQALEKLRGMRR